MLTLIYTDVSPAVSFLQHLLPSLSVAVSQPYIYTDVSPAVSFLQHLLPNLSVAVSQPYQPNNVSWSAEIVTFVIKSLQFPVTFFVLDPHYWKIMAPVSGNSSFWHVTTMHLCK